MHCRFCTLPLPQLGIGCLEIIVRQKLEAGLIVLSELLPSSFSAFSFSSSWSLRHVSHKRSAREKERPTSASLGLPTFYNILFVVVGVLMI